MKFLHLIIIIMKLKKIIYCMKLPKFKYNKLNLSFFSILSFNVSPKKFNDKNNKIRESIIGSIVNQKVPKSYFLINSLWITLKNNILNYLNLLVNDSKIIINSYNLIHKGTRNFNYDFIIIINNSLSFNIEFKFNTKSISNSPQFVSPMNPSNYLSSSYETFFYDNYLNIISKLADIHLPPKNIYLSQIHSNNPKCMSQLQLKYYNGCSSSSKFTNNIDDINFYSKCCELSKNSISSFIQNNELNLEKLSEYLINSQSNKIYMLFFNNSLIIEYPNHDNYILTSYTKNPSKSCYYATSKSNIKLKILLRWKNGNGIAFPAFQIS